jgi:hypothetical protein
MGFNTRLDVLIAAVGVAILVFLWLVFDMRLTTVVSGSLVFVVHAAWQIVSRARKAKRAAVKSQ